VPDNQGRLYYFPEETGRKARLIFDGGYEGGFIHIYEQIESIPRTELQARIQTYGFPQEWRLES